MRFFNAILFAVFALTASAFLLSHEWSETAKEIACVDRADSVGFQPSCDIKLAARKRRHASREAASSIDSEVRGFESVELPSAMTADDASYYLWSEGLGFPSVAVREDLWHWLKANPHSPHYKGVLSELLSARPVEIVPELISIFPNLSDDIKISLMISFSGMLNWTADPQEGYDSRYLTKIHKQLARFLEAQTYSSPDIVGYAYGAILDYPKGADDAVHTRVFYRFLNLSVREIAAIFPSSRNQPRGYSYWARKVATYSLSLSDKQPKAILDILTKFSNLRYLDRKEIAVVFLRRMELYERDQILGKQGKELILSQWDPALMRESYELLSKNKLLLESWAE